MITIIMNKDRVKLRDMSRTSRIYCKGFEGQKGQMGIDYITGVVIFVGVVYLVLYLSTNIITPISKERLDTQYMARSISDFLIINFSSERGVRSLNVVNLTKMLDYLNSTEPNELTERYHVNITIRDMSGSVVRSFGSKVPEFVDVGYVKRVISTTQTAERFILEVFVWWGMK